MKDINEIALAAFLHDLGKPLQRAEWKLSEQAQRMESMLCPSHQGWSSHLHVLWTNDALEQYLHWLPPGLDRSRINSLASCHHRPSEPEHFLISEADRLASGHDRGPDDSTEATHYKKSPLRSVFSRLGFSQETRHDGGCHMPGPLTPDESLFPKVDPQRSLVPDYAELMNQALEILRCWPADRPLGMICSALASWSRRFLTRVPAATREGADVSLHDHACLTAAFAGALYRYHREDSELTERAITDRTMQKFILLSGDLSGIQSYLFDMPVEGRRGRSRSYRARSFYLSMLTHAVSVRLIEELDLTIFNRVMDAGGRFVMLIPNTARARQAVQKVRQEMNAHLLTTHGGRLGMILDDATRCRGLDFMADAFQQVFQRLQEMTDAAKKRKYADWLCTADRWILSHQVLEPIHDRRRRIEEFEKDRDLGKHLPDARFVGLWKSEPPSGGLLKESRNLAGYQMQLYAKLPTEQNLATAASFFAINQASETDAWIPYRALASYIPRLNEQDVAVLSQGADRMETESEDDEDTLRPGQLATFEHLAQLSRRQTNHEIRRPVDSSDGTQHLAQLSRRQTNHESGHRPSGQPAIACLKADVDRLGLLFSKGFKEEVSFGRVATLSRSLDYFFRAFLPARFAGQDSKYRHVYTVFAGGDDLMLIGPWQVMLDLARDLRDWFGRFTGMHPEVTLSAGIALGHGRTPISVLAEMADERLQAAKDAGRNRISLFGDIFTWDEYAAMLDDAHRLDGLLLRGNEKGHLPVNRGFVYRLLQYERMARKVETARAEKENVRLPELRSEITWRSHLVYDLQRNIRQRIRDRDFPQVKDDLEWLESLIGLDVRSRPTRRLKLAATYALYRNRGGS